MIRPTPEELRGLLAPGRVVPLSREVLLDADTPVSGYAKLARGPFSFLLESAVGGERWARYTYIGTDARSAWRCRGRTVDRWTPAEGWRREADDVDPLADLERRVLGAEPIAVPGLPRFAGGWVGFLGYDTVRHIERLPDAPPDDLSLPDATFLEPGILVVIDNLAARARIIAPVRARAGMSPARLHAEATARIDDAAARLRAPITLPDGPDMDRMARAPDPAGLRSSFTRTEFERVVRAAQEYIAAGDVFQAVLAQRLERAGPVDPFRVYRALRTLNPSPYLYLLELDGVGIAGSSPEVLVRVEDGRVVVRPIAGTRPRSGDPQRDARRVADLERDPKELAEHLMLLDLGRNDVGRIAEFESVRVTERMAVERYSHVFHLVSTVEGRLREGLNAIDAFRAAFPAGTVTGAPKVRAMEIIDELEPVRRGPYAGAVGYFGYGGEVADLAIAIRTLVTDGARSFIQAGAGIVADSDPGAEYRETLAKAGAVAAALDAATPDSTPD